METVIAHLSRTLVDDHDIRIDDATLRATVLDLGFSVEVSLLYRGRVVTVLTLLKVFFSIPASRPFSLSQPLTLSAPW